MANARVCMCRGHALDEEGGPQDLVHLRRRALWSVPEPGEQGRQCQDRVRHPHGDQGLRLEYQAGARQGELEDQPNRMHIHAYALV